MIWAITPSFARNFASKAAILRSPAFPLGEAQTFAAELPDTLTGARRLFLKVELLAEGPDDLDYSAAQHLGTDATDRARRDLRLEVKAWWGGKEP